MEILERKENPLLKRVEIKFVWNHPGEGTPTRKDMVIAAAKSEPNADKNLTYIKNVRTVFKCWNKFCIVSGICFGN